MLFDEHVLTEEDMKPNTYTVIYRTGGTKNFQWRKTLAFHSQREAIETKDRLVAQGYRAIIHKTARLNDIGLPTTYEYTDLLSSR